MSNNTLALMDITGILVMTVGYGVFFLGRPEWGRRGKGLVIIGMFIQLPRWIFDHASWSSYLLAILLASAVAFWIQSWWIDGRKATTQAQHVKGPEFGDAEDE